MACGGFTVVHTQCSLMNKKIKNRHHEAAVVNYISAKLSSAKNSKCKVRTLLTASVGKNDVLYGFKGGAVFINKNTHRNHERKIVFIPDITG